MGGHAFAVGLLPAVHDNQPKDITALIYANGCSWMEWASMRGYDNPILQYLGLLEATHALDDKCIGWIFSYERAPSCTDPDDHSVRRGGTSHTPLGGRQSSDIDRLAFEPTPIFLASFVWKTVPRVCVDESED